MAIRRAKSADIDRKLVKILSTQKASVDTGTLLEEIMRQWGGPARLAADVFAMYNNENAGAMTKQRIIEMVSRLVMSTTDRELAHRASPSDMTTDDLHRYAKAYVDRLQALPAEPGDDAKEGPEGGVGTAATQGG